MIEDFIKSEEMRNLSDIIPQKYLNLKSCIILVRSFANGEEPIALKRHIIFMKKNFIVKKCRKCKRNSWIMQDKLYMSKKIKLNFKKETI